MFDLLARECFIWRESLHDVNYVRTRENVEWNAMKFVMNMSISITDIQYIEIAICSDINQCITITYPTKYDKLSFYFVDALKPNFSNGSFNNGRWKIKQKCVLKLAIFQGSNTFLFDCFGFSIKQINISIDLALFMLVTSVYLIWLHRTAVAFVKAKVIKCQVMHRWLIIGFVIGNYISSVLQSSTRHDWKLQFLQHCVSKIMK